QSLPAQTSRSSSPAPIPDTFLRGPLCASRTRFPFAPTGKSLSRSPASGNPPPPADFPHTTFPWTIPQPALPSIREIRTYTPDPKLPSRGARFPGAIPPRHDISGHPESRRRQFPYPPSRPPRDSFLFPPPSMFLPALPHRRHFPSPRSRQIRATNRPPDFFLPIPAENPRRSTLRKSDPACPSTRSQFREFSPQSR